MTLLAGCEEPDNPVNDTRWKRLGRRGSTARVHQTREDMDEVTTVAGLTLGATLAMIQSYKTNESSLLAVIHGCFSWFYVVYHVIFYGDL